VRTVEMQWDAAASRCSLHHACEFRNHSDQEFANEKHFVTAERAFDLDAKQKALLHTVHDKWAERIG